MGGLAATWWWYSRNRSSGRPGAAWWVPALLRSFALLLILGLLARPQLLVSRIVPQTGVVAVLVDDSSSLALPADQPAGASLGELLRPDSPFVRRLAREFRIQWYTFSRRLQQHQGPPALAFTGTRTDLARALERLGERTEALPLAAVILFTDGAHNGRQPVPEALDAFRERGIPIHAVGLGRPGWERDVELAEVTLPPRLRLAGSFTARLRIRQTGWTGRPVRITVRDDAALLHSEEVTLGDAGQPTLVEIPLALQTSGVRLLQFEIDPVPGEEVTQNNRRRLPAYVDEEPIRIFLVEGRPRWEYKFLRRALDGDAGVRLESLLRTALNKFYRQGIEREDSLAEGFPRRAEDLFRYEGLILGDVEAEFFSYGQLEAIRDFVQRRGGGLLMLGGGATFEEAGYMGTPLAEALPVEIPGTNTIVAKGPRLVAVTPAGLRRAPLQLAADPAANRRAWQELPPLADYRRAGALKAGAVALLNTSEDGENWEPLLVYQRFGAGISFVFLSSSSWRWQMQLDHADQRHELFWRQLCRWLAETAEDPVTLRAEPRVAYPEDPVRLTALVRGRDYVPVDTADVTVEVTSPGGESRSFPATWNPELSGVYQATFEPKENGLYTVTAKVALPGEENSAPAPRPVHVWVDDRDSEYFDARLHRSLLEGLAAATGGTYRDLADIGGLPEEIVYRSRGEKRTELLDLYNAPVNLVLLLALFSAEWIVRRRKGWV
ncbi:MAG: Ig-like domain-containing protein [Acidobacteriota bacterium]